MKKIATLMVAAAAIVMSACNGVPSANLKSDADTVSYAAGVVLGSNMKQMLSTRMGIDSAYVADFLSGVLEGARMSGDTAKMARMIGQQVGLSLAEREIKGLDYQMTGNDSTAYTTMNNVLAAYVAAVKGAETLMDADEANEYISAKLDEANSKRMELEYAENKAKGEAFMAAIATTEGVQSLGDGVYYEVLTEGNGEVPTEESTIVINYKGTLVDGTQFDAHDGMESHVGQFIPGFSKALKQMPAGSKWKVYIPQEQAYGANQMGKIPPFSAIVFELELVSVK